MAGIGMKLSATDILGEFSKPGGERLRDMFSPRSYRRREIVFEPHASEDLVFVVASGRIRVFLTDGERELTLTVLNPGALYSTHTSAWVQAYKDSTILVARSGEFRKLVEEHPELTMGMVRVLGDMLKKSFNIIKSLAFKDVPRRLREFLLHEARTLGEETDDGVLLKLDLTMEQLASLLGSSRQTVSTLLNGLVRDGLLVRRERGVLLIPDVEALRAAGDGL